ncbi:MAG: methylenetetrahydrofolate--tRNA-(uracil(54)-C(5))-methyltransferase (FADH(2)-oxidizing) TrmFO [Clostridia bacterium]|nr:methylenetetrahydrofolate--tRNA-(uracil(54)-C(5))-methyltransferase (FADH(2)-oxidizing) TrmFO [Clostridia bacterium]
MNDRVTVIGAGLSGCEAAFQLAERGIPVLLREMKPVKHSPAHRADGFAELVCSNSLRSDRIQNAVGLLKEEMRALNSIILKAADATRVPAGGALAVDREGFSRYITDAIRNHPLITVEEGECTEIPDSPAIIATGPLTEGTLLSAIEARLGEGLHFFDAAAPVVTKESLNMDKVFRASRYGRGEDYLNCSMDREEYFAFWKALVEAECVPLHEFENTKVFEGCMPVEVMAKRGEMTLAFGPLKPVGLSDPRREGKPFAVVQLRQDDAEDTLYNIVGFQTNLKFGEQKRVFGMIPGLENAEFMRYGVMHRNTFINSPGKLHWDFSLKDDPMLYFAGQITGVEGYVESAASGLAAGISLARKLAGKEPVDFTRRTAIGALGHYVSEYVGGDFQPMNVNFGIMESCEERIRNKQERYTRIAERALAHLNEIITSNNL